MSNSGFTARALRFIGILFMALTGGLTLLGGIGTGCVAFKPTGFGPSMAKLAPFQWLYIFFVLAGIALGVLGIRAVVQLVRGKANSYQNTIVILVAGLLVGVLHIVFSRMLRGSSMPVDPIVWVTALTLVVFLVFKIPSIWAGVDFTRAPRKENRKAGGAAAILLGLLTLTIQFSMGSTHTWNGVNYADAFHTAMTLGGSACLLLGLGLLATLHTVKPPLPAMSPSRSRA